MCRHFDDAPGPLAPLDIHCSSRWRCPLRVWPLVAVPWPLSACGGGASPPAPARGPGGGAGGRAAGGGGGGASQCDRARLPLHVRRRLGRGRRLFGDHATARAVEAALSATVHALPPALEPPRHGGELWELLRRRWCELTAPWRELIAAGTSWRELLQDLELRLDLDLGSEDDFEDREYVRGLFEAEYAEAMSYEGHD